MGTDPLELDLPSKGTGGVEAGETPQGPHWENIPVGRVAYGTALVKYPGNVLLQREEGRREGGIIIGGKVVKLRSLYQSQQNQDIRHAKIH